MADRERNNTDMDSSKGTCEVTVSNDNGLHMGPSSKIAQLAQSFRCDLTLSRFGGEPVDAKSMIDLLTLAAEKGTVLIVEARGEDAEEALSSLSKLFESGL